MDLDKFKRRVEEAIKKESQKKSISDVISPKMNIGYLDAEKLKLMSPDEMAEYLKPLYLYSDEDDHLREDHFRIVTLIGKELDITSYPYLTGELMREAQLDVRSYTYAKFDRLNRFLTGFDKIENSAEPVASIKYFASIGNDNKLEFKIIEFILFSS
jgi:hypothetical protein